MREIDPHHKEEDIFQSQEILIIGIYFHMHIIVSHCLQSKQNDNN